MGFLTVVIWIVVLVVVAGLVLFAVGGFLLETDKAKANRYLADQYDKERR